MARLSVISLGFLFILTAGLARADGVAQRARFEPWLKDLRPALRAGATAEGAADALLEEESSRISAFYLQALGKLYSDQDEKFKKLRKAFKDLEDGIGEYDKWAKLVKRAIRDRSPPARIERLRARQAEARTALAGMLLKENWVVAPASDKEPRLAKIDAFLQEFDWLSYRKDKDLMLGELRDQLKSVDETDYDLTVLEEGNGLHELRREIRWFLIEARVLNGLVGFRPSTSACPVASLAGLLSQPIAASKYSQLPGSATETEPCLVSRCLFLSLADAVEKVGKIKDEAEALNNDGGTPTDSVPERLRARAQAVEDGLRDTNVLRFLRDELKACRE